MVALGVSAPLGVGAFFVVAASRGYSLGAVCGLLAAVASLVGEHGLQVAGLQ